MASHATRVMVAQIHVAGYRRSARLLRKEMGDAPLAEFAMTKPDITKKTLTPIQPNRFAVTDGAIAAIAFVPLGYRPFIYFRF